MHCRLSMCRVWSKPDRKACQLLGFKNLEIYNEPFKIVLLSVNFYRQSAVNFLEIKGLANS